MRATRSELVIDDIHAVEALRIVADYFEKDLVLSPGLRTEDRLNIVLPNDSSLETAVMCLNALAETVKCHISDDTIYAYPK